LASVPVCRPLSPFGLRQGRGGSLSWAEIDESGPSTARGERGLHERELNTAKAVEGASMQPFTRRHFLGSAGAIAALQLLPGCATRRAAAASGLGRASARSDGRADPRRISGECDHARPRQGTPGPG
jgi:hypothetical protein